MRRLLLDPEGGLCLSASSLSHETEIDWRGKRGDQAGLGLTILQQSPQTSVGVFLSR